MSTGIILKVEKDLRNAQYSRDKTLVTCLRLIKAEFETASKDKSQGPFDDERAIRVISRLRGREDLYAEEMYQAGIMGKLLPEQLSEDEIRKIVIETMGETGYIRMTQFGLLSRAVLQKTANRAENYSVSKQMRKIVESYEDYLKTKGK